MNNRVFYRTQDGQHDFGFEFRQGPQFFEIHCFKHPPLNGRDDNVVKHHLYSSGNVCFVSGKEPKTLQSAMEYAKQFAEHYLNYIKTGEYSS